MNDASLERAVRICAEQGKYSKFGYLESIRFGGLKIETMTINGHVYEWIYINCKEIRRRYPDWKRCKMDMPLKGSHLYVMIRRAFLQARRKALSGEKMGAVLRLYAEIPIGAAASLVAMALETYQDQNRDTVVSLSPGVIEWLRERAMICKNPDVSQWALDELTGL